MLLKHDSNLSDFLDRRKLDGIVELYVVAIGHVDLGR